MQSLKTEQPSKKRCLSITAAAWPHVSLPLSDLHEVESICGSVFRGSGKASSPAFPFQLTSCRHFIARTSHPPPHPALASCQPHPLHQGEVLLTLPVSYPILGCGQDTACSCVLGCLLSSFTFGTTEKTKITSLVS